VNASEKIAYQALGGQTLVEFIITFLPVFLCGFLCFQILWNEWRDFECDVNMFENARLAMVDPKKVRDLCFGKSLEFHRLDAITQ